MTWTPGWPPQDTDDTSNNAEKKEEPKDPWWVGGWYWPGVVLGVIAIAAMGYSPWTGDSPGRTFASACALLGIAGVITVVYMVKADAYGVTARKVAEAEQRIHSHWESEQNYEHCKAHCSCTFCTTRRYQADLVTKARKAIS